MKGLYRFADVNVRIESFYPAVHALCADYAVDGQADMDAIVTQADIDFERGRADWSGWSDDYLEELAVYRKICERMPWYDAFLFHGSAIAVDETAYLFAAASGTGKSTHARLWREMLGERAVMVNDDKPLIRVRQDGEAVVYGTPWDGKHRLSRNMSSPLKAICMLSRAEGNRIRRIGKREALPMLIQQTYRPIAQDALRRTLNLIDRLDTQFYQLGCNMDISAAKLAYNAMKEG